MNINTETRFEIKLEEMDINSFRSLLSSNVIMFEYQNGDREIGIANEVHTSIYEDMERNIIAYENLKSKCRDCEGFIKAIHSIEKDRKEASKEVYDEMFNGEEDAVDKIIDDLSGEFLKLAEKAITEHGMTPTDYYDISRKVPYFSFNDMFTEEEHMDRLYSNALYGFIYMCEELYNKRNNYIMEALENNYSYVPKDYDQSLARVLCGRTLYGFEIDRDGEIHTDVYYKFERCKSKKDMVTKIFIFPNLKLSSVIPYDEHFTKCFNHFDLYERDSAIVIIDDTMIEGKTLPDPETPFFTLSTGSYTHSNLVHSYLCQRSPILINGSRRIHAMNLLDKYDEMDVRYPERVEGRIIFSDKDIVMDEFDDKESMFEYIDSLADIAREECYFVCRNSDDDKYTALISSNGNQEWYSIERK